MPPLTKDTLPPTEQPKSAMSSPQIEPVPLEVSQEPHGNDGIAFSPPSTLSAFWPADHRRLKKILGDIRSCSPPSSPNASRQSEGLLSEIAADEGLSESGNKDKVCYDQEHFDYADEEEEGYKDEDVSVELSDDGDVQELKAEGNHDTIEDIMNLPGQTAPAAPFQKCSGSYLHDQPTPDEVKELNRRRASIEKALETARLKQEGFQAASAEEDTYDDVTTLGGVQSQGLDVSKDPVFEALQDEIGMRTMTDDDLESSELETFEGYGSGPFPSIRPRSIAHRTSEDNPLLSSSFIDFPDKTPAVMQTPSGKHMDFAQSAIIPDTPFTQTLNYFKQYKGKESPSKRRRNASSPEEIAELAREALEDEEDKKALAELDQYRDMDLAPIEPVMENGSAGDLITSSTPAKARDASLFTQTPSESYLRQTIFQSQDHHDAGTTVTKEAEEPKEQTGSHHLPSVPLSLQNEDNAAGTDSNPEQKQLILYGQQPTFITIIGMLPAAMFWTAAVPIAKYSNKAYDALVNKLSGLDL